MFVNACAIMWMERNCPLGRLSDTLGHAFSVLCFLPRNQHYFRNHQNLNMYLKNSDFPEEAPFQTAIKIAWPLFSAILSFASSIYGSCYPLPKEPRFDALRHLIIAWVLAFLPLFLPLSLLTAILTDLRLWPFMCLCSVGVSQWIYPIFTECCYPLWHFKCTTHLHTCECTWQKVNQNPLILLLLVKHMWLISIVYSVYKIRMKSLLSAHNVWWALDFSLCFVRDSLVAIYFLSLKRLTWRIIPLRQNASTQHHLDPLGFALLGTWSLGLRLLPLKSESTKQPFYVLIFLLGTRSIYTIIQ